MPVIAIDGPAGSGKSTVARAVAARLGVDYLDTGAMYRSVAFAALRRGIDPEEAEAVVRLAAGVEMEVEETKVTVDGVDATVEIRGPEVSKAVSAVAANPGVREEMVRRQRAWIAARGHGVVEGRDIGTVVLPDADVKIYLVADESERARRRVRETQDMAIDIAAADVAADIARRDHVDSTRAASPLTKADDAVEIDTTGLSIDDVVARVLERVR